MLAMTLPSLETLLIQSYSCDQLLLFHNKAVIRRMPNFHNSSKLKYVLQSREGGDYIYRPVACSEDKVCIIATGAGSLLPSAEQSLPAPVPSCMIPSLVCALFSTFRVMLAICTIIKSHGANVATMQQASGPIQEASTTAQV
ncbi:hypothetical protein NM688_g7278 [Phlebia brevispora]|uniref:Uncharacterized protein n=1 Tax=Phlebia brevispora TaxID=194682 RepID=A0ACC1S7C6_9APHY|nr:hypothetical protein NM688_g7278 [Phlebia brevispora]